LTGVEESVAIGVDSTNPFSERYKGHMYYLQQYLHILLYLVTSFSEI